MQYKRQTNLEYSAYTHLSSVDLVKINEPFQILTSYYYIINENVVGILLQSMSDFPVQCDRLRRNLVGMAYAYYGILQLSFFSIQSQLGVSMQWAWS